MKLLTKIWLAGLVTTAMSISAFGACSTTLDMGGYKLTNLGTPTAGTDAATASYARPEVTATTDFQVVANTSLCSSLGAEWTIASSAEPIAHNALNGSADPDLADYTPYATRDIQQIEYKVAVTQYRSFVTNRNIAPNKICVKY